MNHQLIHVSLIITMSLGTSLLAESPNSPSPGAWPRFLNTDFSGSVDGDDAAQWPWQQPPKCRWSLPVGEGYGLGVIDQSAYFHFDAEAGQERLRKLDMRTGEVVWSQTTPLTYRDLYGYESGARCSPTIDNGQIFTLGVAGALTARRVDDGKTQWRVDTNETYHVVQNFFGVGSAPLVLGDAVIVMIGGSPVADQAIAPGRLDRVSPDGSLMVAFDRQTGKEIWKCGDDLASYSSPRTMQVNGQDYVLMFARDHLHLIDPRLGQSIGRVRYRADILESVNAMVPIVEGNRVLVSDCYGLGATLFEIKIDANVATFTPQWQDQEGSRRDQALRSHLSTPVLHNGYLYACSGRNAPDSDFRCVEFATGKTQWTTLSRSRSTASRLGEVLLIMQERGELTIARCQPGSFEQLAVWPLDVAASDRPALTYPCWSAPIISIDSILTRGDQTVLCLELPQATQIP